jgi:hypothetical protein
MTEDTDRPTAAQAGALESAPLIAANDNGSTVTRIRIHTEMLTIARLIGRQIDRDGFEKRIAQAANDNAQNSTPKP